MGILPLNSNNRAWTMNTILRTLWITDIIIHYLSTFWFSMFDAKNFTEFVQSFFNVLHSSLLLTWFSIYYLQRNNYASYIDELETEIEKSWCFEPSSSKCTWLKLFFLYVGCKNPSIAAIYKHIDNAFHLKSKKVYHALTKILLPSFTFPILLISSYKYISSKDPDESFQQLYLAS